jgi:small subunit ribosomal protein S9
MAEDEQKRSDQEGVEPQEEQPEAEAPEAEAPETEAPEAEAPEAEAPEAEAPPTEEPAPEEVPAEEPPAEAPPAEAPPAGEEPPAAEGSGAGVGREGAEGLPPGADLDPIAIDSEVELSAEERARREAEAEERARREAAATTEEAEEPVAVSRTPAELASDARYQATGKRKRSIARVILSPGEGRFEVNERPLEQYFPRPLHQAMARQPLSAAGYEGTIDVRVRVHGGGVGGQAGAVRHGIARALTEIDPELRKDLKRRGFLTRDARAKERRKAGLKKARKRPQFSKR